MHKQQKQNETKRSVMGSRVMERIHAQGLTPTPASKFLFQNIVLAAAIAVFALTGVFFTSVVFFRVTAIQFFGARFIIEHLPWFAGGIALSCLLVTFALLEYYKVLYRFSLISLFMIVAATFLSLGYIANKTQMHAHLQNGRLGAIYAVEEQPLSVYAGRAIEIRTQNSFILETLRGDRLRIYIPAGTRLPAGGIVEGETLFVAGYEQSGQFVTKGVLTIAKPRA